LVINNEYTDDVLLYPKGMKTWTEKKVRKIQAAHGVFVIEVQSDSRGKLASGAALALRPPHHPRHAHDPERPRRMPSAARHRRRFLGRRVPGTLNNSAQGQTPWGTYLTCEENLIDYFHGRTNPTRTVVVGD
jgi:secreted PhoX family phosphatase